MMWSGSTRRWNQRPQDSNWGDLGPDDQLGRLTLLAPEKACLPGAVGSPVTPVATV